MLDGRDPSQGVLVAIPPHTGSAVLRFALHNRHTYSEEQMKAGRGFARYTAVIGALSLKGDLIDRAAVQTEFRSAKDIYERISGGAGPGGVKAVAPVGNEQISITIPAGIDQVSLLGEVLDAITPAGRESAAPGRPVAIVSNVTVEYKPKPAAGTGSRFAGSRVRRVRRLPSLQAGGCCADDQQLRQVRRSAR